MERVWEIITQAEHVGKWFGDAAEIDLRPGGAMTLRSDGYATQLATVELVDPPRAFSYRWKPGVTDEKPSADDSTLVEFTPTPQDGQTRLRVVETGFGRLPRDENALAEQVESNTKGWAIQLRDLHEYVEALAK